MDKDEELIKLGKRIRNIRKFQNKTIEDLALDSNVNRNYLGDLERGKRNPSFKVLLRIIEQLQMSVKDFFKYF